MRVGLLRDRNSKLSNFSKKYLEILEFNGIDTVTLDISDASFWESVGELSHFIFDWKHLDDDRQLAHTILPIIENDLGKKCFPDQATCWHYDDKIRQYYLLKARGFPVIDTWVFWNESAALEWTESADYPLVFKLRCGAGSSGVRLVENRAQARKLCRLMFRKGILPNFLPGGIRSAPKKPGIGMLFEVRGKAVLERMGFRKAKAAYWQKQKNYALFQRFLPDNDHDTRVTIIGERALAVRRRNRGNDFRASGSGAFDFDPDSIDRRFLEIAFDVSERLGLQSIAYDFLYGENREPLISEISYRFPFGLSLSFPGYWGRDLQWHPGRHWRQYYQLVDFLEKPDLLEPPLEDS